MAVSTKIDVVVIGAGAAGLMCALHCAQHGLKVVVLEHAEAIGKKIRISGGGRCNFTNTTVSPENYLSQNPHFCRSALARYKPKQFIDWIQENGIAFHEKKLGQLFCDDSADDIVQLFASELARFHVKVYTGTSVHAVRVLEKTTSANVDTETAPSSELTEHAPTTPTERKFEVLTSTISFCASAVVIATGGLSIPKMGASDFGLRIAQQFGLKIIAPRPALVPLVVVPALRAFCSSLAGLSFDTIVSCNGTSFREHALFTHRGLSGPAILQISSYWQEGLHLHLDILPERNALHYLEEHARSAMELKTVLSFVLAKRFAEAWCSLECDSKPMRQYTSKELESIAHRLHHWELRIEGTEGFAKAEVTAGGVDTRELSSKTMECSKQPGLYFIGEVVDVTGWLGGYNFQWAWASGVAAAEAISAPMGKPV